MSKQNFEIKKLSARFYNSYPELSFPEILHKTDRPYLVLLITIANNKFALPFRTNIRHNSCYKFKSTTRKTNSSTGIDFSKAVIVNNPDYLDSPSRINEKEYTELLINFHRIESKFKTYLNNYINYANGKLSVFEVKKYAYSSMKYFHTELGILKPLTITPSSFTIYQLKDPTIASELLSNGKVIASPNEYVNISQYREVYTGTLPDTPILNQGQYRTLTDIYRRFQNNLPVTFTGKPISTNDVILIGNNYSFIYKIGSPTNISFFNIKNFTTPLELAKSKTKTIITEEAISENIETQDLATIPVKSNSISTSIAQKKHKR